jgi:hypothetical protein
MLNPTGKKVTEFFRNLLAKVFLADCSSGLLAVVFSDILPLNPKSFATKARVDTELAQR